MTTIVNGELQSQMTWANLGFVWIEAAVSAIYGMDQRSTPFVLVNTDSSLRKFDERKPSTFRLRRVASKNTAVWTASLAHICHFSRSSIRTETRQSRCRPLTGRSGHRASGGCVKQSTYSTLTLRQPSISCTSVQDDDGSQVGIFPHRSKLLTPSRL